jgi:hypothetical protein
MVDEIESLGAKLKAQPIVNWKGLKESEVPVLESRLIDQVADVLLIKCAGVGWVKIGNRPG